MEVLAARYRLGEPTWTFPSYTRPRGEQVRKTQSQSTKQILEQMEAHGIEFGKRYRDPASDFEGEVTALYFYKHGCMRVALRGRNATTGEPAEFTFDAPELVEVATEKPVPSSRRTGGPHDLKAVARSGPKDLLR